MGSQSLGKLTSFLVEGIVDRAGWVLANLADAGKNPSVRATHSLATSLRRLMTARFVVRQLYGTKILKRKEVEAIKSFCSILGNVRDVQEMRGKVVPLGATSEFLASFSQSLKEREESGEKLIRKAIDCFDSSAIERITVPKAVRKKIGSAPLVSLDELVERFFCGVREYYREAIEEKDDSALHKMRIAYKRFRYTVELFSPHIIPLTSGELLYLKTFQDAMGLAHDWLVIDQAVSAYAESTDLPGKDAALLKIRDMRKDCHEEARAYIISELDAVARIAETPINYK
ncbi:MAG: CHAD domain-containing protein [Planctomycetes bacterium]|nr:CHAD domain-containing protein [Planctomycetota bacterium]